MQVAASPSVTVVAVEDVDKEMLERERAIEMQKEDLQSKPQAIRCASTKNKSSHCRQITWDDELQASITLTLAHCSSTCRQQLRCAIAATHALLWRVCPTWRAGSERKGPAGAAADIRL